MLHNYHTHTTRCNHATGTEREYIENAIKRGLKTLGFSDHAPYLFPDGDSPFSHRMRTDELHEYADTIRALAKEYANDIRILCGFELEYYPDYHADEMAFLGQVAPDYILLGQHFIGNEHSMIISSRLKDNDLALTAYVTQVLAGLATGDFLYLAHPDLAGYKFSPDVIEREYRRLCRGAKRMGVPLEINFLGLRANRQYPSPVFFQIAAEEGNDIVLGVDAHEPDAICDTDSERRALEMVKTLGLNLIEKPLL